MKVRAGFVSNSSSSSFVCDICGREEAGYDGEYGISVATCDEGHAWCNEHSEDFEISLEQKRDIMLGDAQFVSDLIEEDLEPIKSLDKEVVEDSFDEYLSDYGEWPSSACPICNLRCISSDIILEYLEHGGSNIEQLEQEIRDKYSNLSEFRKAMKEKK